MNSVFPDCSSAGRLPKALSLRFTMPTTLSTAKATQRCPARSVTKRVERSLQLSSWNSADNRTTGTAAPRMQETPKMKLGILASGSIGSGRMVSITSVRGKAQSVPLTRTSRAGIARGWSIVGHANRSERIQCNSQINDAKPGVETSPKGDSKYSLNRQFELLWQNCQADHPPISKPSATPEAPEFLATWRSRSVSRPKVLT